MNTARLLLAIAFKGGLPAQTAMAGSAREKLIGTWARIDAPGLDRGVPKRTSA